MYNQATQAGLFSQTGFLEIFTSFSHIQLRQYKYSAKSKLLFLTLYSIFWALYLFVCVVCRLCNELYTGNHTTRLNLVVNSSGSNMGVNHQSWPLLTTLASCPRSIEAIPSK